MYAGSFAASLKGIACTRGFVIFTRVRVNKRIPPFAGECFSLFPFAGLYMLRPLLVGNVSLSPPRLASNGSIPLRSTTIPQGLHEKILLMTTSTVIPGSR